MTDACTIGPVSIENAHLYDQSTFEFNNSATRIVASGSSITQAGEFTDNYGFELICTFEEALQLKGIVEMGEVVWMNTSDLTDNDYLQHKGWVLLTSLTLSEENATTLCSASINYIKISDYEPEYLTMDYSKGYYDGINIVPSYTPASTVYQLQDDGSDITTNWTTARDYRGTLTASTDGAEFDLALTATTDHTPGWGWIICDTKTFTPPFTFETVLDRNSLPGAASDFAEMGVAFSTRVFADGDATYPNHTRWLELNWNLTNTISKLSLRYNPEGGGAQYLYPYTNTDVTKAEVGIKMVFTTDGRVRLYTDVDTVGTWTQVYYGPHNITDINNGVRLYLFIVNKDSTSFTGSFQKAEVYNADALGFPNLVMAPAAATNLSVAATGTRVGAEGTSSYWVDPSTERRFQIAVADYYKNSVKLMSTNNTGADSLQVFSTGHKLTPTTTTLSNGMTKLTFDADQVILSCWDAAAWHEVDRFEFTADIDYFRPLFINSERVVLQINDTKWTMLRSSPIVTVEHPATDFDITLRDRIYHDGVTLSGAAGGAAVTMTNVTTGYYALTYDNAADTYQLLIVKKDPTSIVSDNIPADTITGLGWYKKADAGYDAAASKALQWYKQTRTGISLKQII